MGDSDQGFRCALWLQGDNDVPQLATLAERMRARAAAASDPADLPWARDDDTDLRAFLAAQPCPPFDRLRAVTAADVYEAEEAAFQKWRYQMRLLVAALRSDAMAAASKALVEEHTATLYQLWLLPHETWPEAARAAGLQHGPSTWPAVRPLVLAALDAMDARHALHFLPQLSSALTRAAVHSQACAQAASRRAAAAADAEAAAALDAAAAESAEAGARAQLQAGAEVMRRLPHRFATLRRRNATFLDDAFMFVRHVITTLSFLLDPPRTMDEDARGHCRATPDFLEALRLEAAALTHTALHTVATLLSLWLQDPSEAAADADALGADGADTESVVPAVGQCRHCNVMGTAAMRCSGCRRVSYCDRACQSADWSKHKSACRAEQPADAAAPTTAAARPVLDATRRRVLCSALSALAPLTQLPHAWSHLSSGRDAVRLHLCMCLQRLGLSCPVFPTPWDELAAAYLPDPEKTAASESGSDAESDSDLSAARSAAAHAARVGGALALATRLCVASSDAAGPTTVDDTVLLAADVCAAATAVRQDATASGHLWGLRNAARLVPQLLRVHASGGGSDTAKGEGDNARGSAHDERTEALLREEAAAALHAVAYGASDELRLDYKAELQALASALPPRNAAQLLCGLESVPGEGAALACSRGGAQMHACSAAAHSQLCCLLQPRIVAAANAAAATTAVPPDAALGGSDSVWLSRPVAEAVCAPFMTLAHKCCADQHGDDAAAAALDTELGAAADGVVAAAAVLRFLLQKFGPALRGGFATVLCDWREASDAESADDAAVLRRVVGPLHERAVRLASRAQSGEECARAQLLEHSLSELLELCPV